MAPIFPRYPNLILLLVLVMISIPLFWGLSDLCIRQFDEARLATNALEMRHTGNWLVTTFHSEPDLWNTKPPLFICLQAIFLKILGINEWATRLPSALAGFFTCIVFLVFTKRFLGSPIAGYFGALVLVTSAGYVTTHGTRTGDYDALLCLWVTTAALCMYAWVETAKAKHLYFFFIALTLGCLTKGIAGLLFLPGYALYILYRRKLITLFKSPAAYIGFAGFLVFVVGYYLLRENASPGYIAAVSGNEWGGRFLHALEQEKPFPFWHYAYNLAFVRFAWWLPLWCLSLIFLHKVSLHGHRRLIVFLTMVAIPYLLVISSSQTKWMQYDMVLYPLMALQIGVFVYDIFILQLWPLMNKAYLRPLRWLVLGLFLVPYFLILNTVRIDTIKDRKKSVFAAAYYLREANFGDYWPEHFYYVSNQYSPHVEFYMHQAIEMNMQVRRKSPEQIKAGDRIMTDDPAMMTVIESKYNYNLEKDVPGLKVYVIRQ